LHKIEETSKTINKNNIADNVITEKELVGKNKKLNTIFKKFDVNKDNVLDAGEVDKVLNFIEKTEEGKKPANLKNGLIDKFKTKFNRLFMKKAFINGEINTFHQNNYGDCWLLSALKSLSLTKAGKKIIKNSISTDDKGNVIVELKGVHKKYTISQKELLSNMDSAIGDYDVQAMELAFLKYNTELLKKYGKNPDRNNHIKSFTGLGGYKQPVYGGFPEVAVYLLSGQKSKTYVAPPTDTDNNVAASKLCFNGVVRSNGYPSEIVDSDLTLNQVKSYFKDNNLDMSKYSVCLSFKKDKNRDIVTGHEYALKSVNKNNTVTVINPWNSNKEIVISKKAFFNNLYDLSIAEIKDISSKKPRVKNQKNKNIFRLY